MRPGARRITVFAGVVGLAAWVSAAPHASRPIPSGNGFVDPEPRTAAADSTPRPRVRRMPRIEAPPVAPVEPEAPAANRKNVAVTVQVISSPPPAPMPLALEASVPNPFQTSTAITFSLPRTEHVSLDVYDMTGRRVATLIEGDRGPGRHSVVWNATDAAGVPVNAGVYFCRLNAGQAMRTQKLILSR